MPGQSKEFDIQEERKNTCKRYLGSRASMKHSTTKMMKALPKNGDKNQPFKALHCTKIIKNVMVNLRGDLSQVPFAVSKHFRMPEQEFYLASRNFK